MDTGNLDRRTLVKGLAAGVAMASAQGAVAAGAPVPQAYAATDFDRMLREHRPDALIVTTPDATHDDYIVRALGKREFYTPAMARRMGLNGPHERCTTCPEKAKCTFYMDLAADAGLKALYVDNEKYDGYFRDQCVWRENISIEDTMNVIVGYDTGTTMSYSLNAFNGTKGRLDQKVVEQAFVAGAAVGQSSSDTITTSFTPLRGTPQDIPVRNSEGDHGGGDAVMLVGASANVSFRTGQTVQIADLVKSLARPDLPRMPGHEGPVPMPVSTRQV